MQTFMNVYAQIPPAPPNLPGFFAFILKGRGSGVSLGLCSPVLVL